MPKIALLFETAAVLFCFTVAKGAAICYSIIGMPISFKKCVDDAGNKRILRHERIEKNRILPQKKVPLWELAVYMLLPAALVSAGIFPLIGIIIMPIALVLLYFVYRRYGIYLPIFVIAAYDSMSLTLNYNVMTVVYACFISTAFLGLVFAVQFKKYLLRAVIVYVMCVVGALGGCGVVALTENSSVAEVASSYVVAHADEPFFDGLIRSLYESGDVSKDERVEADDPDYKNAATEYAAEHIREEAEGYVPYYCIHFGGIIALIAFFGAAIINNMTVSPFDENVTEKQICFSTRSLGGVHRDGISVRDMRIPRLYLLIFVLPAFIASIILGIAGGLDNVSATVMHAFVTVPSEFAFITLAAYIATLFNGKGRIIALIVLGLLFAANVFSVVFLVCSIFGVCDTILNIRYWLGYLSSET